jgi:hypothetical protein
MYNWRFENLNKYYIFDSYRYFDAESGYSEWKFNK